MSLTEQIETTQQQLTNRQVVHQQAHDLLLNYQDRIDALQAAADAAGEDVAGDPSSENGKKYKAAQQAVADLKAGFEEANEINKRSPQRTKDQQGQLRQLRMQKSDAIRRRAHAEYGDATLKAEKAARKAFLKYAALVIATSTNRAVGQGDTTELSRQLTGSTQFRGDLQSEVDRLIEALEVDQL